MAKRRKKPAQNLHRPSLKLPSPYKLSTCTALCVKVDEVAMNNVVLRVPLINHIKKVVSNNENQKKCISSVKMKETQKSTKERVNGKVRSEAVKNKKTLVRRQKSQKMYPFHTLYTLNYAGICPVQTKINVDFMELSDEVNIMKLPSPTWQVTVMMKHDFSTTFKFISYNPSKCVTFSQANPHCKIFMNGTPVILLGCPKTINSRKEIEILLDIVHRLDFRDCMVAKI